MHIDNIYPKPAGGFGIITPQAPISNLVFEGGGPKGLVYIGALEILAKQQLLDKVQHVAGSSAGAMTALMLALGYSHGEIKDLAYSQDSSAFTDLSDEPIDGRFAALEKAATGLSNLLFTDAQKGRGIFLGNALQQWFRDIIAKRVDQMADHANGDAALEQLISRLQAKQGALTFLDLEQLRAGFPKHGFKALAITGTNYTQQRLDVFTVHDHPNMPLDLAARISASLPWFFKSIKYEGDEYMDGGCLNNFPMHIFDAPVYRDDESPRAFGAAGQNLCTLGFKVDSQAEIQRLLWESAQSGSDSFLAKLKNGIKQAGAKIGGAIADGIIGVDYTEADKQLEQRTYGKYSQRTIQIPDMDYSTFNFNLDNSDKDILTQAGRDAVTEWLGNYYNQVGVEVVVKKLSELEQWCSAEELASARERFPEIFSAPAH